MKKGSISNPICYILQAALVIGWESRALCIIIHPFTPTHTVIAGAVMQGGTCPLGVLTNQSEPLAQQAGAIQDQVSCCLGVIDLTLFNELSLTLYSAMMSTH